MPKTSLKIPEQLKVRFPGYESLAVGRFSVVCSVVLAMFWTLVFALLTLFGHTVVQAAGLL
ncbi:MULTISPECIES: hypothetical protein [Sinorhizobium]|uniref:hypothetical protein n=1 Tax=Sinorhizobium TaxID=28105 RepID=UPI000FD55ACD|nr:MULTISPECIES: hypothetical protein [Sinorhizobium]RVJ16630.1 hypothetical protein CN184_28215 [Sinorhizobium medicae]RVM19909.1 hypothetical protein CN134_02540 [Sinorhizobium meliloti]RVO31816.1 hypothetical protein CN098_11885 [Sinorhizobium meliloti]